MTEQEATDRLEELVGSIDGCFRLMRLYQRCREASNALSMHGNPIVEEERFRLAATLDGYSLKAINHYLNFVR